MSLPVHDVCLSVAVQSVADELDGFEQLFHQYLLDRKASASTVTWNKIESLPEAAVSGGGGRREQCAAVCHKTDSSFSVHQVQCLLIESHWC